MVKHAVRPGFGGLVIRQWKVLCSDTQAALLLQCLRLLDRRHGELLRIAWPDDTLGHLTVCFAVLKICSC